MFGKHWCSGGRFSWDPIRQSESLGWKIFRENSGVCLDGGGTFVGFLRVPGWSKGRGGKTWGTLRIPAGKIGVHLRED